MSEHASESIPETAPAGVVTAIQEHPRRPGRFTVLVDGEDLGAVSVDAIAELGLRVGLPLTPGRRSALTLMVQRTALLDRALDLLAVRARSTVELRRRLARLDAGPDDVAWVEERLRAQGYLDDTSFARQYARSRLLGGGVSKRRIQDELYGRGVPRETALEGIDAALAETQLDEFAAARAAAERRLRSLQALDPAVARRRLYGFLARRGYEPGVVSRVLREVLDSDAADDGGLAEDS
ncbi:MAG TPA: regulatory protein RecX [Gemmatimonadaceae bacterium]